LIVSGLTAAAPAPNVTFNVVDELPSTMNVGETATFTVQVESDQEFLSAQAMPAFEFAGKGVVAVQGGDRAGRGTSATLQITFKAKGSTAAFPNGYAPVHVVIGVRYPGGIVVSQEYVYNVTVP
jgi:hypothetical protein